ADEMAAINVGDWLHGLSGPMGDLTDGSAQWWTQVLLSLEAYYKEYINAPAVRKLQLKPDDFASDMLKEAKWLRVDKRAASMLLQAIPENIRTEVLANRLQTTLSILARILTIYRPGSSVERQQVLKALEQPGTATSPMELVESLRRWARWLKRAQDLGLQVPDSSILLRGIDQASKGQLEKQGEVAFRANMLRTHEIYYNLVNSDREGDGNSSSLQSQDVTVLTASSHMTGTIFLEKNAVIVVKIVVARAKIKNMKGAENKRDDGTVPAAAAPQVSTSVPSTSGGQSGSLGASTDSSSSAAASGDGASSVRDVDDFLKNATQILKMMADQQTSTRPGPSMKILKKVIKNYEGRMALVDSGATHPLRTATFSEWSKADEVDVVVAGDGVKRMRQNASGTLLMGPESTSAQTILPLGSLVSVLGYDLVWTKKKCILRSPEGMETVLRVTSGCPEVSEATALELIAKIEQEKVVQLNHNTEVTKQAMARARDVQLDPLWERSLKDYVAKGKFEDGFRAMASAPWAAEELQREMARILTDLPVDDKGAWDLMQQLGFNRRMRKRMMAKDWVVKLCSGRRSPTDKWFKAVENNGTVVLDIDTQRLPQLDLLRPGAGVMMMLLWGAATGRIAGVLSGLPRHNALEHSLRAVVLYEVATAGREATCKEADVPLDGVAFSLWASSESEEDESSLVWMFKWFRRWSVERRMDLCHFEQGGLGHPMRRPTTMVTNLDVVELKGVQDSRSHDDEDKGTWSQWAPMFVRTMARGLKRWRLRPGWYTRMVKAMKASDRKAWERHLANDHVPYRADCLQCIHNATGRPHRKCLHRDCYVLSADTLGPVRVAGVKGERYAVVFTYQFPKQKLLAEDQPITDEDLDGWTLDVKPEEAPTIADDADDYDEYVPDLDEPVELSPEEQEELRRVQQEPFIAARGAKKKEISDDWWEFRESSGVLIRHHVTPRTVLFRPTSWNGCPISPSVLDYTRVTEVKYMSGGVDTETSDWHGPQSGSRALERPWTGCTMFTVSTAEVLEDEAELKRDEETWEKIIGDLTKPVEMDTIYLVYPVRARRGGDAMLAVQEAVLRLKLLGLP
ncbi:GIP, partial [Symbiodinium necroappetens]